MKKTGLFILLSLPLLAAAGVPQPSCTCFGLLKDQYGQPYLQNARILFQSDGRDIAEQDIDGLLSYGINFQVSIEMDSGSGTRYVEEAMREGETLDISVEVDGAPQPLLGSSSFTMPAPGSDIQLQLTTGTDTDGDGLPDEWEQQIIASSGGAVTNINQITPGGDFDGDGASNMQEYLAGTYAFLDYDIFAIEDLEQTETGQFIFRFLSVPGKSYGVEVAGSLTSTNGWITGSFSLGSKDSPPQTKVVGDGYYKIMYIEADDQNQGFMRLIAE